NRIELSVTGFGCFLGDSMSFSKRPATKCDYWRFIPIRLAVSALGMTLCWLQPAQGQVAASIKGVVADSSGAPVASATVSAKNTETGAVRVANTDDAGRYQMA